MNSLDPKAEAGSVPSLLPRAARFRFSEQRGPQLTHYLFKFPAKFHPPVVRELLAQFTRPGQTILDPFCGSGTLMVEASTLNRNSIGGDVDPLSVFISRVKTHRFNSGHLKSSARSVLETLSELERPRERYEELMFSDTSPEELQLTIETEDLWVPRIPNIGHWFRNYVLIDLARILGVVQASWIPVTHKGFLLATFASIIRNCSNADPVPVSGLEVTAHMRRRDQEGRLVNPFALYRRATLRALDAAEEYGLISNRNTKPRVLQLDATQLSVKLPSKYKLDALITSPPYSTAVDYYRRHKLEMFWLGLTHTQEDRLELLNGYLGRSKVPNSHPFVQSGLLDTPLASEWAGRIRTESPARATSFKHYIVGMRLFFGEAAKVLARSRKIILVVADSSWREEPLPTTDLLAELASSWFKLSEEFWYPSKNRYMSYSRHNRADIRTERILVLQRR